MALVYYVRVYLCFFLFVICNISTSKSLGLKNLQCEKVDPCRCLDNSGQGIDLRPLNNVSTPTKFITVSTPNVVYYYHPCSNWPLNTFNETDCKQGSVLCIFKANQTASAALDVNQTLSNTSNGVFYKLATAEDAAFVTENGKLQIVYKNGNNESTVILECSEDAASGDKLTIVDTTHHVLKLTSPHACLRSDPASKHLSGFSVFLIILFSIFALYFIGGMLVLKFIRGAEGKEMIPNYEFWVSLPLLIKEGCLYVVTCGQRTPDSYERI